MRGNDDRMPIGAFETRWPARLVVTDQPDDWSALVEQIAELEELLTEAVDGVDVDAIEAADHIRELLEAKRRSLHAIDVG